MYKVLLVDDEKWVLTSLEHAVPWQEQRFTVVGTAHDGKEALEALEKELPDLVVTDIRMPVLDGLDLIRQASARWPSLQFIIISGYAEFEYARQAMRYGVAGYCLKPVEKKEMVTALKAVRLRIKDSLAQRANQLLTLLDEQDDDKMLAFFTGLGLTWDSRHGMRVICGPASQAFLLDQRNLIHLAAEPQLKNRLYNSKKDSLGLSGLIYHPHQLEQAIGEAQVARMQSFIQGKPGIYIHQEPQPDPLYKQLALIQSAVAKTDRQSMIIELKALKDLIRRDQFTIKQLYYCYNRLLDLLETSGSSDTDDETALPYLESYHQLNTLCPDLDSLFTALAEQLSSWLAQPEKSDQVYSSQIVKNIIRYLDDHYQTDISLIQLARDHHLTASYLCRLFKRETGQNLSQYLVELRLRHACRLLKSTTRPITEIAHASGYQNYFYFARLFKRTYGITPTQYRQSN